MLVSNDFDVHRNYPATVTRCGARRTTGTATGPVIPVQPDTSPLDMHGLAGCGSAVVPTAGLRVSHGDFARTGTRNRRGGDGPTVGGEPVVPPLGIRSVTEWPRRVRRRTGSPGGGGALDRVWTETDVLGL